jgi:FtsH-binding integral membrane protein
MSSRTLRIVVLALAIGLALSLAFAAAPALADTSSIGRNLGDEVRSWATALLFGVAALVGLPILFRRDVNAGLILVLLVVVVGGFVFAPASVREVIRGLWHAIGG